jgi:hypothetical protein
LLQHNVNFLIRGFERHVFNLPKALWCPELPRKCLCFIFVKIDDLHLLGGKWSFFPGQYRLEELLAWPGNSLNLICFDPHEFVIPAKACIQFIKHPADGRDTYSGWTPAFAGATMVATIFGPEQ